MRELLHVSGLVDNVYWAGQYLGFQTMLVFMESFMLVVVYWGESLLTRTNPFLVYQAFLVYGNGAAIHGIFLSCFLSSSKLPPTIADWLYVCYV